MRPRRQSPRSQSPKATLALPSGSTPETTSTMPSGLAAFHGPSTITGTPFEQATGPPSSERTVQRNSTCWVNWFAIRKGSIAEENASIVNLGNSTKATSMLSGLPDSVTWADPLATYLC